MSLKSAGPIALTVQVVGPVKQVLPSHGVASPMYLPPFARVYCSGRYLPLLVVCYHGSALVARPHTDDDASPRGGPHEAVPRRPPQRALV